jgi:hypothetical protein
MLFPHMLSFETSGPVYKMQIEGGMEVDIGISEDEILALC